MIHYDWLDLQKPFSLFLRCKLDESDARTRLSIYSFKVKFIKKKKKNLNIYSNLPRKYRKSGV